MKIKMPSQNVRAYVYRVIVAGGAVAAFYGLLSANELVVWLGLAATALMVLPASNTPTGRHAKPSAE